MSKGEINELVKGLLSLIAAGIAWFLLSIDRRLCALEKLPEMLGRLEVRIEHEEQRVNELRKR